MCLFVFPRLSHDDDDNDDDDDDDDDKICTPSGSSAGGFAPESRGGAVLVDVGGSLVMTNVAVEDCQAQVRAI